MSLFVCLYEGAYVVCMCVHACVFLHRLGYLWGSENNQHNRWPLFRQKCGVQNCHCAEHRTTVQNKLQYVRMCICGGGGGGARATFRDCT